MSSKCRVEKNVPVFVKVGELSYCVTGVFQCDHIVEAVDDAVDHLLRVNKSIDVCQDPISTHYYYYYYYK